MNEFKLWVPTYNADAYPDEDAREEMPEFGDPHVPILAYQAEGLRVILGSHSAQDHNAPDIQIERQHGGWVIFLHPLGGSDASGFVYFMDDGRSFLRKEIPGPTPELQVLGEDEGSPLVEDKQYHFAVGAEIVLTVTAQSKIEAQELAERIYREKLRGRSIEVARKPAKNVSSTIAVDDGSTVICLDEWRTG